MNATAVATKAPSASRKPPKTDKGAKPIVTEAQRFMKQCQAIGARVQATLRNANSLDPADASIRSGNTLRFARMADQTLSVFKTEDPETPMADLVETLFDAVALIDAAYECPGDQPGAARIALYDDARAMLCELLDSTEYKSDPRNLFKPAAAPSGYMRPAFLRGRDLAIEMLKEGQRRYELDTSNALRTYRTVDANGVAPEQNDFVRPYLDKIDEDSTLIYGFSAVLSAALTEQPTDDPEGYRVPMDEFQAGKPGADGTGESLYDDAPAKVVTVTSNPEADAAADAVNLHYKHALAVLELTAHEIADSGLIFAARNLMRADLAQLMAAFDKDVGALEDAGASLSVVLELIAAAAHTVDGEEGSCVWGAHALATLGMNALDEHIRKIKRAGAAS